MDLKKGKVTQASSNGITSMGNQSYKYVIDAGQAVGTKGQTNIFLVLSKDGGMITAYPLF